MVTEEIDYEKIQKALLNQYLANGKESILRRILSLNPEKKKIKPIIRTPQPNKNLFRPKMIYNNYSTSANNNSDPFPYSDSNNNDVRKFDFCYDPMYKDKQMRGSSKWASQKFNVMKVNIAKRQCAPIESIQLHKIEKSQGGNQLINGNMLSVREREYISHTNHLKPIKIRSKQSFKKGDIIRRSQDNTFPMIDSNNKINFVD